MKYLIISILSLACIYRDPNLFNSKNVLKIDIKNGTDNDRVAKRIVLTDFQMIDKIITELNAMKKIFPVNVKAAFGEYEMKVIFKDHSEIDYLVVYTTYNGVVIVRGGIGTYFFKNDRLESLILWLFQPENADKSTRP